MRSGYQTALLDFGCRLLLCRVAHAMIHISGIGLFMVRTVVFTIAWAAFITFAIELLRRTI